MEIIHVITFRLGHWYFRKFPENFRKIYNLEPWSQL